MADAADEESAGPPQDGLCVKLVLEKGKDPACTLGTASPRLVAALRAWLLGAVSNSVMWEDVAFSPSCLRLSKRCSKAAST
jgi:hypothetical protein